MPFNFLRRNSGLDLNVVIISGACCFPSLALLDEQARRIVEQAITETGISAHVKMMPATTAYFGAAPKRVIADLMNAFNQSGRLGVPAVLINDEPVSYGVPEIQVVKAALLRAADANTTTTNEEKHDESATPSTHVA